MSFSDLLALTSQLSEPEPEPAPPPPSDAKEDLQELKASLNEIKLVQDQVGAGIRCRGVPTPGGNDGLGPSCGAHTSARQLLF
jgi:hypothetical protein